MSMRSRLYKTHAVVLRRRNYGDADRILAVLTPSHGKRELIAHGVRKPTSRKAGHLETFSHVSLLVAVGRTWDIITEATTVESFRHLRQDLDRIALASYVCELVDRFTELDDENRAVWDLLVGSLRVLDSHNAAGALNLHLLLRWFELHLLSLTGFQPQLFHCLQCGREIEPARNFFSLEDGGILCHVCGPSSQEAEPIRVDVLKVLRHLQRNRWEEISHLSIGEPVMRRVDNLLYRYLVSVMERRLTSAEFLRRLQSLSTMPPDSSTMPSDSQGKDIKHP
jgi:DNA repair protein RecO (recombination protein O)